MSEDPDERIDKLESKVEQLREHVFPGRRDVLRAGAGLATLGAAAGSGYGVGAAEASAHSGDVGTATDPARVFASDIEPPGGSGSGNSTNIESITTENIGDTLIWVSEFSGTTLAQRLSSAISAYGSGYTYYIPRTDPDGNPWSWDSELTLTTDEVVITGNLSRIEPSVGSGNYPINITTADRVTIDNLWFEGGTGDAHIQTAENETSIHRVVSANSAGRGIVVTTGAFKSEVSNCRVSNAASDGIRVDGVSNVRLENVYSAGCGDRAFDINNSNDCTLINCAGDSADSYGLHIDNSVGMQAIGFHSEGAQQAGTSTDHIVRVRGSGTQATFIGGIIDDRDHVSGTTNPRRGFVCVGGTTILHGTDIEVANEEFSLSRTATGEIGGPVAEVLAWGLDPRNPTLNRIINRAMFRLNDSVLTDLSLAGETGRFPHEVRKDNGANTAADGLYCHWDPGNSQWVASDGTTFS